MSEYRSGPPRGRTPTPSELPRGNRTRSGRNSPPLDNGTVALAISGMSFYWMMPALMRKRRRPRAQSPNPAPEPGTDAPQGDATPGTAS